MLRFSFSRVLRPAPFVCGARPALYVFDDVHSSSRRFNDDSAGVLAVSDFLSLLPSCDCFWQQ